MQQATIDFVNKAKNNPEAFNKNTINDYSSLGENLVNEALTTYVNDDLVIYKEDVINFSEWNNDQLLAIEAIFIVFKTLKDNFTQNDVEKFNKIMSKEACEGGAWWAPLGFWGVCTVVGVLTVGVAGIACAGLVAARVSYCNYQNQ